MKIEFCGAANGVTGSCHLITTDNHRILLDCGQFQGGRKMDELNFEEFPFDPAEIDCMILSHAHIDHCGRIPLLVKRGFKGDIYCTDATADLLKVMLEDSGYIHEKEAEWKNRKNQRAGKPLVEPLYTFNDATYSLKYLKSVLYDQLIKINGEISIVFNDAGHILGSAITELFIKTGEGEKSDGVTKVVFSGDLGVEDRPLLRNPTIIKSADYVIMETTYGNRVHQKNATSVTNLLDIVIKTVRRGGTVVIPSFAVGRTQELIFEFDRYFERNEQYRKELENIDVYIDSPMATTATEVFRKNAQVFDDETKAYITSGNDPLDFKNLKFSRTTDESKWLNEDDTPKVIISASGMCEAGRIRHHLKHNLWDPKSSIIFVGYQAEGTLGKLLVNGAKDIRLFGEDVHVRAEIYNLEGFSGHADRNGLLHWLSGFRKEPERIFLVHGEEKSKEDFASFVRERLGFDPVVVHGHSEFILERDELVTKEDYLRDTYDEESVKKMKDRISSIKGSLDNILYNTNLAIGETSEPEKLAEIQNALLQLEKSTLQLGSEIAGKK